MSEKRRKKKQAKKADAGSQQVELLPDGQPAATEPDGGGVAESGGGSPGEGEVQRPAGGAPAAADARARAEDKARATEDAGPPSDDKARATGDAGSPSGDNAGATEGAGPPPEADSPTAEDASRPAKDDAPSAAPTAPSAEQSAPTAEPSEPTVEPPTESTPDDDAPAKSAPDPRSAESILLSGERLTRARDFVESGRVQDAIAVYLQVIDDNPDSLKAHNNLGVLLDGLKQHALAVEHLREAERIDSGNVEVLTNLGSALTALALFEEADDVFKRAMRHAPEDPQVRLGTGILSFRRGMYGQAEIELKWVCDKEADNGPAFYYRGEALNRLGRYPEAMSDMERASELMPEDPRPYLTLGHLLDRDNRRQEAGEMFRRARTLQGVGGP